MKKRIIYSVLAIFMLMLFCITGCTGQTDKQENQTNTSIQTENETASEDSVLEDGQYTSKDDVVQYLQKYHKLPGNYITKKEARELGWEGGSLEPYAPGKCIGGDRFGNREGVLPSDGYYKECDIDTLGADSRGAKRIVYSDDGRIYYTEDHYETFELVSGEEK